MHDMGKTEWRHELRKGKTKFKKCSELESTGLCRPQLVHVMDKDARVKAAIHKEDMWDFKFVMFVTHGSKIFSFNENTDKIVVLVYKIKVKIPEEWAPFSTSHGGTPSA